MCALILTQSSPEWMQGICLLVALLLSALIGLDRKIRHKQAGLRTHTLVGLGAALFMVVSKYAFDDVLQVDLVRLDPSRVAAQIVSGVGFIGAGLVFVRRNQVRGLTTAASIWLTAAIGTAAGGGLVYQAIAVTAGYFAVIHGYPWLSRRLGKTYGSRIAVKVRYRDGAGVLRRVISECTASGFVVHEFNVEEPSGASDVVEVELQLVGSAGQPALVASLSKIDDVLGVEIDED